MKNPDISAEAACDEGTRHLKSGEALLAYDVLAAGLRRQPGHVRLRQLMALAMARSGASRDASAVLDRLVAERHVDEETLALLARTHKDIALESIDPAVRNRHLDLAFRQYQDAYQRTGGYWSGINAATMAVLLHRRDVARTIAARVREQCLGLVTNSSQSDLYWILATLGEAAVVAGELGEADDWYARAVAAGVGRRGDLISTRRNARMLLRHLGLDPARFDTTFDIRRVVVFSGHLIDRPERLVPRFPPALEPVVREAIDAKLAELRPGTGYAAAGSGGDILFLEGLTRIGAQTHVVLPYNREQFCIDSVDLVPGSDWPARFRRVLEQAVDVSIASEQPIGGGMTFEYGFRLLDGTARIRADELDTELICLALWDGLPGDGPGGTASSIAHWRKFGRTIEIINLYELAGQASTQTANAPITVAEPASSAPGTDKPRSSQGSPLGTQIVGLLFADAVGFSRLHEPDIPIFVEHYLGSVAQEISRASSKPIQADTWGDGLYIVFDSVAATGVFALRLSEAIRSIDWRAAGLHQDISIRIGLHAGPAYVVIDPVTRRRSHMGAHVSRAARIEPIAPPGEVYASVAFAALARADHVDAFRCSYVGQTPLAKGYGTFPTYVVRRAY